jgi:mRNA interferase RelE/StbE
MASYEIEVTRSAEKALFKLPKTSLTRVLQRIEALADDPFPPGCKRLVGQKSVYRLRVASYRIVYEVLSKVVRIRILKIGHRKHVYR